jgi:hypothetical protein
MRLGRLASRATQVCHTLREFTIYVVVICCVAFIQQRIRHYSKTSRGACSRHGGVRRWSVSTPPRDAERYSFGSVRGLQLLERTPSGHKKQLVSWLAA